MTAQLRAGALVPGFGDIVDNALKGALTSVKKYFAYRQTYTALNRLSTDALLDLDLYRGDLKDVARRAVYGR